MTSARIAQYALVRGVPETYERCVTSHEPEKPVDISGARRQHGAYCETLRGLGLELVRVEPDDQFPDCCFVEDPAIVAGDTAIISRMGVPARRGEEVALERALRPFKEIRHLASPGTLEGGDVLQVGNKIYVGLSNRTNRTGLEQVDGLASELGFEVIPVEVRRGLHLKSSCTYIGDGYIVMVPGSFNEKVFAEHKVIEVARGEGHAANCLPIEGVVLVLDGYPNTRKRIEAEGFDTRAIELSEFEKCEGALTCLSIVF